MFETLEDAFEKSKPPLDRGWPILLYSGYVALSSIVLALGVRGHGFSHLFRLVVWAAMLLLSMNWLVTSLKSSVPITRHDFFIRSNILLTLLMADDLPYILR
jgi:hypothetical protein